MIVRTLAAAVAGAFLLAGCGQTSTGVAARLGDEVIETSTVADRVSHAYKNEQFAGQQPKEEYQRQLLKDMILSRLVEEAARRLGVRVSDQQVRARLDEVIDEYGGREEFAKLLPTLGFRMSDAEGVIRTELLQREIFDKLVADIPVSEEQLRAQYQRQLRDFDTARISHILVHDAKLAARVVKRAKEPGADFAALARRYSEDPETKEGGGDLGQIGNGEGRFSKAFEQAVFKARTGDVVGPIRVEVEGATDVTGYEIVKVVERRTRSFETVREDVRRAMLRTQRTERFNKLIGDLARELGVKVNPRFGRWDPQRMDLVPADGTRLSSPAPEPGAEPAVGPPPIGPPAGQPGGQPGQPGGQPGQPGGQPPAGQPGGQPPAGPSGPTGP